MNCVSLVRKNIDPKFLNSFVEKFGSILDFKNFLHFLLKYTYTDNWEHELQEDYFGFNQDIFVDRLFWVRDYDITYKETFQLPHIKDQLMKDFGFHIEFPTHIKLILEKNWR